MSYLWQEFNIKTFPAETLVFRDGVFCEDLSDYKNIKFENNIIKITKTDKLPVHIIYIGEISGNNDINIDILSKNSKIFLTSKIKNKKPAFLNIFVKNTGENSELNGKIIAENNNNLKINIKGQHFCENTGIFIKTNVIAYKNTETELNGYAIIDKNSPDCESDISFSVMADEKARIIMKPTQYINSVPKEASHSASLYKPNDNQIIYLRESGLSGEEIKQVLKEAFMSLI